MRQFRDLDDILVEKPIRLPIRGKTYEFPGSIPARTGLMLQRIAAAAAKSKTATDPVDMAQEVLSDEEEIDLRGELMGDAEVQMARDGLTTAHTAHVFQTLIIWHMAGEEAAATAWENLGKATPNRAARRASKGSATTTKPPASTSGTTTRQLRPAPTSPGPSSSRTGT